MNKNIKFCINLEFYYLKSEFSSEVWYQYTCKRHINWESTKKISRNQKITKFTVI